MLEKLKEKLKNKNLLLGIIGVLVIGGTAVGGYWYLNREKSEENGNGQNQEKLKSEIIELGDGWNKYINHEYGFSFEYPSDWTISGPKSTSGTYITYKDSMIMWAINEKEREQISIAIIPNQATPDYENIRKERYLCWGSDRVRPGGLEPIEKENYPTPETVNAIIGGKEGYLVISATDKKPGKMEHIDACVQNKSTVYTIHFNTTSEDMEIKNPSFIHIMKTLEFPEVEHEVQLPEGFE